MSDNPVIGFIGLGVMGEPICRNMLLKSGYSLFVHDIAAEPVARLVAQGATAAATMAEVFSQADIVFLSLPGGPQVEAVIAGPGGCLETARSGQVVVDMSTAPVGLTRALADRLAAKGILLADAPVARTRQAAETGTLSIMVGASDAVFARIKDLLFMAASEVTHCGDIGCGQVVKILNNMVLFETVVALSEALVIGEAAGVGRALLLETLSKGSADSFALRNHGMKAMVPDVFPVGAFPTEYALKDVSYALDLARDMGILAPGAELAERRMTRAREAGFGQEYFPVLTRVVDRITDTPAAQGKGAGG
ncbi:NAD(P)-dependent oxidoreductase [Rhodospirillum sp. A1_3_36]|uniref:NAD(P)-dependent oxidoreductase n=1 Tax=Rhodospirillum sp. A1_3_36 TaxID=3391666 RepID=UPI0039A4B84C